MEQLEAQVEVDESMQWMEQLEEQIEADHQPKQSRRTRKLVALPYSLQTPVDEGGTHMG